MLKKILTSSILLGACLTLSVHAQQIPYLHSGELIEKGIKEHDEGNYKKAIAFYNQVPEGDTNYLLAVYEQSLSALNDTDYVACIALCQKALQHKYKDRRQVLLTMGAAYDRMDKEKEAEQLYDSVARLYPHDNRPYYEKAVVHFNRDRLAEAESLLQKSLMLNPLHFRSHYLLGSLYTKEGRLTEAIMALQASLLCTNNVNLANGPIALLNAIALQTDKIAEYYSNKKPEYTHPVFNDIDEIVQAKLALNKGYKLKTPIEDNIIRQIQVVLEKLSYDSKDSNFAMQYYVPLLKSIYDKDQFESFVLLLFSEYGIESIDKMAAARKGKAKLEEVKNIVYPYLSRIGTTRVLNLEQRTTAPELYNSFPGENLLIVGKYADKEKQKFAPGFVQMYEDQALVADGNYNADGKKNGTWNYYYAWEKPRLKEEYKNGTITGEAISWYENGNVRRKGKFGLDGVATEKYNYEYNGTLESKEIFKGNNEYEVTYYHPEGTVKRVLLYANDKVKDGSYPLLYPNGKVNKEMSYKDEKLHGAYKSYFLNGKPDEICSYKDDQLDGEFLSYYENGKLAARYYYVNGQKHGLAEEFYEDGTLSMKKNYNNGKSDGETLFFDKKGKVYGTLHFKNDRILDSKFLNAEGKIISDQQNYNNATPLKYYNEYGNLSSMLHIDENGTIQGKVTYYFLSGGIKEETETKDGHFHGTSVTYHKNGNIESRRQYKDGSLNGYYQAYFPNGNLRSEGWIKEGITQGVWHSYDENGKLSRDFFMLNGELNGPEMNYESNGRKNNLLYYDHGMIVGITQFDTTSKVIQETTFDKGEGLYKLLGYNGAPAFQCSLKHGELHGPYTIQSPGKKLIEKGTYILGKRNGDFITYYPNGKMRLQGLYDNGEKTGRWINYDPEGTIENITYYAADMQEGPDSSFVGNQLRYVTQYHNDIKDGTSTIYGDEGKIAGILYYDRGNITGYSYEGSDGKLLPVTPIVKGTADIKTFYANGSKAMEFKFINNCYEGSQKLFYANGKLAEDRNFEHNNFDGTYTRFNADGSKLCETQFKKDIQQGEENKYDAHGKLIYTAHYIDGQPHGKAQIKSENGLSTLQYYYGTLE